MTDCCIALANKRNEELKYRAYVTDLLKALIETKYENLNIPRYIETVLEPKDEEPETEETGDEVIARITRNLAGMGK